MFLYRILVSLMDTCLTAALAVRSAAVWWLDFILLDPLRRNVAIAIGLPNLLVVAFSAFVSFILPISAPFVFNSERVALERVLERSSAVAVYDSAQRFGGFLLRHHEPGVLHDEGPPVVLDGQEVWSDHKTIMRSGAPEHYWRCLVELEDRHFATPLRNPFGVDFGSTVRIPYQRLFGGGRGGSTIHMQIARSVRQAYAKTGEGPFDQFARKWDEWRLAGIVSHIARQHPEGYEVGMQQLSAMHLPHIQRTYSYVVYGVDAAALTLFGAPADALSPAQQFALAASVQQNFGLDAETTNSGQYQTWRRQLVGLGDRLGRAEICALQLLDEEQAEQALAELNTMAEVPPSVALDEDLNQLLAEIDVKDRFIAAPESRLLHLAPGVSTTLIAEARDRAGHNYSQALNQFDLTVDLIANRRFTQRFGERLDDFFDSMLQRGVLTSDADRHPVIAAVADEEGRILRFFSSSADATYLGSLHNRERVEIGEFSYRGRYRPETEMREIASIGKVLAALALSTNEGERPQLGYRNNCRAVTNARCYCEADCDDPRDYVTAYHAFGESLNDALINRLAATRNGPRVSELAQQAGFTLPSAHASTPPESLATYGRYTATPRRVQGFMMAALRHARGETGPTNLPTLVSAAGYKSSNPEQAEIPAGAEPISFVIPATDASRSFILDVLSSPICYEGGTLYALRRWCPSRSGVRAHVAKTGTRGTGQAGLNVYDWWIVGALETQDGNRYSYLIHVGSGSPNLPFTDQSSGYASSLAAMLLAEIEDINTERASLYLEPQ